MSFEFIIFLYIIYLIVSLYNLIFNITFNDWLTKFLKI